MDHDRTDRIPLAESEPRCEPSKPCTMRSRCARYQAAIPKHGATMDDYTTRSYGGTALCPGFIASATLRKAAAEPAPARPYMRGLT